jgi:hypothetical protein
MVHVLYGELILYHRMTKGIFRKLTANNAIDFDINYNVFYTIP